MAALNSSFGLAANHVSAAARWPSAAWRRPFYPESLQDVIRVHSTTNNLDRNVALEGLIITNTQEYLAHPPSAEFADQAIGTCTLQLNSGFSIFLNCGRHTRQRLFQVGTIGAVQKCLCLLRSLEHVQDLCYQLLVTLCPLANVCFPSLWSKIQRLIQQSFNPLPMFGV